MFTSVSPWARRLLTGGPFSLTEQGPSAKVKFYSDRKVGAESEWSGTSLAGRPGFSSESGPKALSLEPGLQARGVQAQRLSADPQLRDRGWEGLERGPRARKTGYYVRGKDSGAWIEPHDALQQLHHLPSFVGLRSALPDYLLQAGDEALFPEEVVRLTLDGVGGRLYFLRVAPRCSRVVHTFPQDLTKAF